MTDSPNQTTFGLLPQPEGRIRSFVASSIVNLTVFGVALYAGISARQVMQQHYEETELIVPAMPPAVNPHRPQPAPPLKINVQPPHIEPPKPLQEEAKLEPPPMPHIRPQIAHTPQPRPALAAAMPAQNKLVHPSMAPVHLGDTFGATPNPNAVRPATVAALGNPYGGLQGEAVAPHGVVKSTGIGDSTRAGAGGGGGGGGGLGGRVASVGMPSYAPVSAAPVYASTEPQSTSVEVLSKPPVQYPAEARQLRTEGDVVLSVTFLANGQVLVQGVIHGLGHGLDQEAIRVAQQIRFRPATVNGRPVDVTTHVTIAFQLA
jgi:TonB family protein